MSCVNSEILRDKSKKQQNATKGLMEKQFTIRNSPLTDLFENIHIRTVYHIFVAIFIGLFLNILTQEYLQNGRLEIGYHLIAKGFSNFHLALVNLFLIYLVTTMCFWLFNIWSIGALNFVKDFRLIWNYTWLCLIPCYYLSAFYFTTKLITFFELGPASASLVSIELVRSLMKVHAFVRENCKKILHYKPHSEQDLNLPNFRHFLYFYMAPTLIYRDTYPRTNTIRWDFVCKCIVEIIAVVFFVSFIINWFLFPTVEIIGIRPLTINEICLICIQNAISGILLLLAVFYVTLHTIQNLFGELLCFGDRLFYKYWWTSTSYDEYYRTWNVVVHDWLYTYVYKDVFEQRFVRNRIIAKLTVFTVSAIVHEWILVVTFGFFFPVLLIEFLLFGTILNFIKLPKTNGFNILFWYGLALGSGTAASLYTMEFNSRWKLETGLIRMNHTTIDNMTMITTFSKPLIFTHPTFFQF